MNRLFLWLLGLFRSFAMTCNLSFKKLLLMAISDYATYVMFLCIYYYSSNLMFIADTFWLWRSRNRLIRLFWSVTLWVINWLPQPLPPFDKGASMLSVSVVSHLSSRFINLCAFFYRPLACYYNKAVLTKLTCTG